MIVKYHEPTMVVADDGTIIIAAYCENINGVKSVLNTVSHDGGETWKTNWTSGILSMAWDRHNHRLCGIRSGTAYISDDYGMSWKKIGSYDNRYVTDDMNAYCLQLKKEEKRAYDKTALFNVILMSPILLIQVIVVFNWKMVLSVCPC